MEEATPPATGEGEKKTPLPVRKERGWREGELTGLPVESP